MKHMRRRVVEIEEQEGQKVKCPICGFRCRYCPLASLSTCSRLRRRLETGEWS